MNNVPIPVRKLCLTLQFDLSECDGKGASLPSKDHNLAIQTAAKDSGLFAPGAVVAKAVTIPGDVTIAAAQDVEFDEESASGEKAVAVHYIYSSDKPQMVLRCLVCLADVDGVTALRIAMHALELVEGQSKISSPAVFAAPPPYKYGWRQRINFGKMLSSTLGSIAYATMCGAFTNKKGAAKKIGAPDGVVVPTTVASTLEYYKPGGAAEPAAYHLYADNASTASQKPYRRFIDAIESWRKTLGLRAVFVLINATPRAIPAEVPTAHDVLDIKKRYAGAFDYAVAPPGDDIWPVNNFYHSRVVFVNNYGRHKHNIKAKATAFKWDWVGMAAHVWGCGCVSVNGRFLGWMRGTKEGLAAIDKEATEAVGDKVETLCQMKRENITEPGKTNKKGVAPAAAVANAA